MITDHKAAVVIKINMFLSAGPHNTPSSSRWDRQAPFQDKDSLISQTLSLSIYIDLHVTWIWTGDSEDKRGVCQPGDVQRWKVREEPGSWREEAVASCFLVHTASRLCAHVCVWTQTRIQSEFFCDSERSQPECSFTFPCAIGLILHHKLLHPAKAWIYQGEFGQRNILSDW